MIMLSAHGSEMRARAVAAGASSYIEKTATTREIVDDGERARPVAPDRLSPARVLVSASQSQ